MDRTEAAKDFYQKHLNDPYSKQRDTAAFHLLGLQLDSIEARYDSNSGAVGNYTQTDEEVMARMAKARDPFEDV